MGLGLGLGSNPSVSRTAHAPWAEARSSRKCAPSPAVRSLLSEGGGSEGPEGGGVKEEL